MASADKTIVLITGGITSKYFELAAQLLPDPSKHIILGSRTASKGEKAVQELQAKKLPGTIEFVQIDISNEDSISIFYRPITLSHLR
ncbi:hypothetical protein CC80DRAFT_587997 [Byssothecium circinans]|uniref:Ketoreductase (KR) domain-containing protein n=1 Tax=Byssothecium circinans TaxID=147558 RepID=A0A6A5URC3_9PLEO|nr:hypothetical protein CC80DRAFT_587997 [Byssothecium circinans]